MRKKTQKPARWHKKKGAVTRMPIKQLAEVVATVESMSASQPERIQPVHPSYCFNMMLGIAERLRMIDYLWTGEYKSAQGELAAANPALAKWLADTTKNKYNSSNVSLHTTKQTLKFESMLAQLLRCHFREGQTSGRNIVILRPASLWFQPL